MTAPADTLLLTLDEVATELRFTKRTVETLISEKTPAEHRLKSLMVGGRRRVRRADLTAYLDARVSESA